MMVGMSPLGPISLAGSDSEGPLLGEDQTRARPAGEGLPPAEPAPPIAIPVRGMGFNNVHRPVTAAKATK